MSSHPTYAIPESIALSDVKSEQIRYTFSAVPSSLLAILAASLCLSIVQWEVIDHDTILGWFLVTNLISLVRLTIHQRFKRLPDTPLLDAIWYQLAYATALASGLCWAAAGILLYPPDSIVHQVFLAFVVAGISAGAITTLAAILNMARSFVILSILPVALQFYLNANELSLTMTLMTLYFMVMILISAKRLNQTIVESLTVRNQRELAQQTIRYQALYDELTELPNRRLLLETMQQEISTAERHNRFGAVFFIDLDRFKAINDSMGHTFGDELLVQVAKKITQRLRFEDTAARLGGDEFVVLLGDLGKDQEAASTHASKIAEEIRSLFETPLTIHDQEIHLTISIGIAIFPANVSAEDMLKYADVAMYQAKKDGRDKVRLFSTEMQEAVERRRRVERGLRQALDNNEFELYFQTQFDENHQISGAESLLRWNHPEKGVVAPGYFIDTAEQSGLIVPIGDWVLRSACEQLARLDSKSKVKLSVNVSPRQFADLEFIGRLKNIIAQTSADPSRLVLEITEGLAISNIEHSIDSMNQLRELGITFSLDDFGTGYSSLSYLNRLPVDELKIDRSFVTNITNSPENAVIVDTIIVMAEHLKLAVVSEGVETEDELNYLIGHNCHYFQGYYFSRPVPFEEFNAALGR